ncbi:MAG: hypothetical protein ABJZ55_00320 [Fuerstiella sp.]
MPFHLLFPLASSFLFVFGVMSAKQAIVRGASPWTGTFWGNQWLAIFWVFVAVARGSVVGVDMWLPAAVIGAMFVLGQLLTYLAFQVGDVSVATPVFGIKVIIVATLQSLFAGELISGRIWIAGIMATSGVVLIQWVDSAATKLDRRKTMLSIVVAGLAAFTLSLFDVSLQAWAKDINTYDFMPVMFGFVGLFSLVLLPKVDSVRNLKTTGAFRWMFLATILMAMQAFSMCFSLAEFGDAARINIVYALRGLWGVLLAWALAKRLRTEEAELPRIVMIRRLAGAGLLTGAVLIAFLL